MSASGGGVRGATDALQDVAEAVARLAVIEQAQIVSIPKTTPLEPGAVIDVRGRHEIGHVVCLRRGKAGKVSALGLVTGQPVRKKGEHERWTVSVLHVLVTPVVPDEHTHGGRGAPATRLRRALDVADQIADDDGMLSLAAAALDISHAHEARMERIVQKFLQRSGYRTDRQVPLVLLARDHLGNRIEEKRRADIEAIGKSDDPCDRILIETKWSEIAGARATGQVIEYADARARETRDAVGGLVVANRVRESDTLARDYGVPVCTFAEFVARFNEQGLAWIEPLSHQRRRRRRYRSTATESRRNAPRS
jgi:hypothetical protein